MVAVIALLLPSCLNIRWSWVRDERYEPVRPDLLEAMAPGDDLETCLAALGAPLQLWEYAGDGMALAYASGVAYDLGFSISSGRSSGSFNFDSLDENLEGVVLVFDPELRLRWIRYGVLSELVPSDRRPPAAPADEPDSGAPSADDTRNEFPD